MIMNQQSNLHLIEARQAFIKLREEGHLAKWAAAGDSFKEEATVIRQALNRWELVGIGIKNKMLDERIYRDFGRKMVVSDWIACRGFVAQARVNTKVPTYFCEVEWLAKRWANGAEKAEV